MRIKPPSLCLGAWRGRSPAGFGCVILGCCLDFEGVFGVKTENRLLLLCVFYPFLSLIWIFVSGYPITKVTSLQIFAFGIEHIF